MVQGKTLPDQPKQKPADVPDHCINKEVCGMKGTETVYGPAIVGGDKVVYNKGVKKETKVPKAVQPQH